jgi:SAM-dependent methyltransferase
MKHTSANTPNGADRPITPELIRHMTRNEADMAFRKRVQSVFDWLPPREGMTILDMPCGRGFYLNMLRYVSPGVRLVGGELDRPVIEKAARNVGHLPGIALVNCNIYAMPFPDETFDGVIVSEILEHVDDDVRALREVMRVLKPGGVAVITVPNADYPFWWDPINKTLELLFKRPIRRGMFAGLWANHVRLYRLDQLRETIARSGFILEEERAFTHHSFPFIHNLVYGIGMPLLESGALSGDMAKAANRLTFDENDGSLLNPINLGIAVFNWFDRHNAISEPIGRSTVNLAAKVRKPS